MPDANTVRYDLVVTTLVQVGRDDDTDNLRLRITELEGVLRERAAEVAGAQESLGAFRMRYKEEVGRLHEELDEIEALIEAAELGEISRRLKDAGRTAPSPAPQEAASPRYTSDVVRRLFRDVAKTIHPDLARDERTRDRRHTLMIEANRAYALGDEERLRRILQAWEGSPEAVEGSGDEASRERLVRRIAQIDSELAACAGDLAELKESPLWKLNVMVDEASAKGKDLVGDMVKRLKRDILAARNRLDAIRSRP